MYWDIWWSQVLEFSEVRGLCIFGSLVPFLAYFYPPQQISFQLIQEILQTLIKSFKDDAIPPYLAFCFTLFMVEWIAAISLFWTQHRAEDYKDMGFFSGTYLGKDYDDNDDDDDAYEHIGGQNSNTDRIITLFMNIIWYHCYTFVIWLYYVWVKQPERGEILLGYIIIISSMLAKTVLRCRDMYFIIMDEIKNLDNKYHIQDIQDIQDYLSYVHNHRCD